MDLILFLGMLDPLMLTVLRGLYGFRVWGLI